jgi:hypothetical protein
MPTYQPRKVADAPVVNAIRVPVVFGANGATTTASAQIPANSVVISCVCAVTTAFNAATTNTLKVGDGTTDNKFMATGDITAGSIGGNAKHLGLMVTADSPVVVTYNQSGTAATAGAAEVVITYYPLAS